MLTCIYHPIDPCRVVEQEEAERLIESGVWFDCPTKAKSYRNKVEEDIKKESQTKQEKPKAASKEKLKEKSNERQQNGSI